MMIWSSQETTSSALHGCDFVPSRPLTSFRFGVGAQVPQEIENGTFTRRVPTSDDKLLQQLIGKKAAKAHLDARQANKNSAKQPGQKHVKPQAAPKEESEDEEEGRASAFKSKKRKTMKTRPVEVAIGDPETNDRVGDEALSAPTHDDVSKESHSQKVEDESDAENIPKSASKAKHQSAKPASYLDQLLAERSKKKKIKSKLKIDA